MMEKPEVKAEVENTEEEIDMISFRKTNDSVEENMTDLDNREYILIEKQLLGDKTAYNLRNNQSLKNKSSLESSSGVHISSSLESHNQGTVLPSNKAKKSLGKDKLFGKFDLQNLKF